MARVMVGLHGPRVELLPQDVLGVGGEATVFRHKKAIKVYHQPSFERAEKLRAFLALGLSLPSEVVVPEELVLEESGRRVIGFTMRLLPVGQQVLDTLASRKHRETFGFTNKDVIDIFIRLHEVLRELHKNGFVVGDLNPLNQLYRGKDLAMIDVDSYQFGQFPCKVATVRCLEPRLYGKDLSLQPLFIPNDDWYAYLVLLYSSLLLVHPYGGAHRSLRTIPKRALARLTVFDNSVIYPPAAYAPEVISDDLLQLFELTFKMGKRGTPDIHLLHDYCSLLIECPICGLWYPHRRKECPGCKAINQQRQRIRTVIKGVRAVELLNTGGPIIFFKLFGTTMYCVAREHEEAVLYVKESLDKLRRLELFKAPRKARYDIFDKYLVVCTDPYGKTPGLKIFDISGKKPILVTATTTESFGGRGAVFRGSTRFLYRLVGGLLLRGQIPHGVDLAEEKVATALENQTWFDVAADPNQEIAFGYFRIFGKYEWFLVKGTFQISVPISQLEPQEALIDRSVRFSTTSLLLLRKTVKLGKESLRLDVVDLANGEILSSRQLSLGENPQFLDIHATAYAQGVVLTISDSGILAENVKTGSQREFPETVNYVNPGDHLWRYEDGILVVSGSRVLKLTLVKS